MTGFFDLARGKIGHRPTWTTTRDYVLPSMDLYPVPGSNGQEWELRIMVGGSTAIRGVLPSMVATLMIQYYDDPEGFVRTFMRREPPSERQASHAGSASGKPRQGPVRPDVMEKSDEAMVVDLDLGLED